MSNLTPEQEKQVQKVVGEIDVNEDVADLAEAILRVADAGERLLDSKLSKRAIQVLLKDITSSRIGMYEIESVLEALPRLKGYIKK